MFASTLPPGSPDLIRASAFKRYLGDMERHQGNDAATTRLSTLSPSLMQDLMRFESAGAHSEALDVVAASVRHARDLVLHLQSGDRVLPITLFPLQRLVHCPVPMATFLQGNLSQLQVLQVEPAVLRPLGHADRTRVGEAEHYAPMSPLLWELALRGARDELLPEIAGPVAYRIAAGAELREWRLSLHVAAAVKRLKQQTSSLREMAQWPGLNRERASRLLNALYLHAALMVSRTHPIATSELAFRGR